MESYAKLIVITVIFALSLPVYSGAFEQQLEQTSTTNENRFDHSSWLNLSQENTWLFKTTGQDYTLGFQPMFKKVSRSDYELTINLMVSLPFGDSKF